jgi:hypothetical protein
MATLYDLRWPADEKSSASQLAPTESIQIKEVLSDIYSIMEYTGESNATYIDQQLLSLCNTLPSPVNTAVRIDLFTIY